MSKNLQAAETRSYLLAVEESYHRARRCNYVLVTFLCLWIAGSAAYAQTGPAGVGNSTTNKVWLKADAGFAQGNNSQVALWRDQSGNSFNAVQSSSPKRPIYRQTALNGKPALFFNRSGSVKYLDISTTGLSSVVSNSNTIYVVGAAFAGGTDNSTNAYQALVAIPGYHSGVHFRGYESATHIWMTNWLGSSYPGTAPTNSLSQILPITQGNWYILSRGMKEIPTGTTQQSYVNGTLIGNNSASMQMTNYTNNVIRLGAANISGSNYIWGLNGAIAEVIVFNTVLNDAQRTLIDNYLSTKYNLTISNDLLQNNDPSFVFDVQGIGTTDGGVNKHTAASNGRGLHLSELNNSLNLANEFLLSAHGDLSNKYIAEDMPTGRSSRWNRVWYIEKTGQVDAKLSFDVSEAGLSQEVDIVNRASNFKLIYKSTVGGTFDVVKNGADPVIPVVENGDQLSFSLSDSELLTGYYTIMITETVDASAVKKLHNGLITSTQWRTDQPYLVTDPGLEGMFMYAYDDKYQIKDARMAENVNYTLRTFDLAGNKFRLTDMSYDPNGNILSLKRFDKDELRQHNFSYNYKPNTNQLQSIGGYTHAYTYNAIGQMVGEDKVDEGKDQFIEYDVTGKVLKVFSKSTKLTADLKIENLYDDRGFRLAKVNYATQRTTWYIRDASGNLISTYEQIGTPSGLFSDLSWRTLSNVVVDENGRLTVAPGASSGIAVSSTKLKPYQDGYFEYVIEDAQVAKDIGFQQVGYSSAYLYRFNFYSNFNIITVRKGGMMQARIDYVVGDVIKLARIGGNVHFYHNNSLRWTIAVDQAVSLELNVRLNVPHAKVSNLIFKYTTDPNNKLFTINKTEIPIYGSGKLGTYYPQQDASTSYEITDHLGNVRALLRDDVMEFTATMEDSNQEDYSNPRVQEMAYFQNLFETEVDDPNMNHTSNTATVVQNPSRSAYLFWQDGMTGMEADDKATGPSIAREVNPGDIITAEAYARYEDKETYNKDVTPLLLASLLGNNFVSVEGFEGYTIAETTNSFSSALSTSAFFGDNNENDRPFAYVSYIIFDKDMAYVDSKRARVPEDAGFEPGEEGLPDQHKLVSFENEIVIPPNGKYIYLWVSNESENTKVWFDDFKVTHSGVFLTQATDYGVWGDVLREQKTDESIYRFGYQGQFAEKDEETGWNHFELREYDPVIGRFTVIDPARQFASPYIGMGNNPTNYTDPTGGCVDADGNVIPCDGAQDGMDGFHTTILDGVAVSAGVSFDAEIQEYDYGASFQRYQEAFPEFAGMSNLEARTYWDAKYSDAFFKKWREDVQREKDRENVAKLAWFIQGFTTAGSMSMGSFGRTGGLPSTRSFNFSSRYTSFQYSSRLDAQTDAFHNYPYSFDKHIKSFGSWSQRIKDGANWYEMPGVVNGESGFYQLGINQSKNLIFHRNFVPLKKY